MDSPAQTNSQHFEAMLQSIHQGQIILLQIFQMIAPPDSIHKEDEGPTAQVPQHMEDESSEAIIPEPFDIGEEAEETQVRQVATATPERSLEATTEPSAPVVNLPSPQPAAGPPPLFYRCQRTQLHQS